MDATAVGIYVGMFAVLLGIFALMWQINNQSNRLEAKIDVQGKDMQAQGKELEAKIEAQGKELEAKIDVQGKDMQAQGKGLEAKLEAQGKDMQAQGKELEAKIEAQGKELRAEVIEQGRRVSQSELEQARLNGVNSVLLQQTHTHDNLGSED